MIGLGSYWAWMNLSASNAALFPWLVESAYPLQLIVSSCAYLLTMAALFAGGRRTDALLASGVVVSAACVFSLVGSLAVMIGETSLPELVIVGQTVVAMGTAVMLVAWGSLFCEHEASISGIMVAGSFVVGCSLYLLLVLSPLSRLMLYVLPVLLGVCGGLLLLAKKDRRTATLVVEHRAGSSVADSSPHATVSATECLRTTFSTSGPGSDRNRPSGFSLPVGSAAMFGCLLVCVFLNEVIRIVSTPLVAEEFTLVGILTQAGGLAVAGVALLALVLSKKRFSFNAMSRFLLPLMVAGFLSFLVFDREDAFIMFILLGAGYWCLQMLICIALCDAVDGLGLPAARSFALLYGLMQIAILAAKPLGHQLSELLRAASSGLALIVSTAVLIVVVLAMYLLRDGALAVRATHSNGARDQLGSAQLDEMAREFGLSPRETEVFHLLARGRSLPVIMKELTIAKGTAQTHVRHVYEKTHVHTKQELIDLIEDRLANKPR